MKFTLTNVINKYGKPCIMFLFLVSVHLKINVMQICKIRTYSYWKQRISVTSNNESKSESVNPQMHYVSPSLFITVPNIEQLLLKHYPCHSSENVGQIQNPKQCVHSQIYIISANVWIYMAKITHVKNQCYIQHMRHAGQCTLLDSSSMPGWSR